jgi:hypothetical protein
MPAPRNQPQSSTRLTAEARRGLWFAYHPPASTTDAIAGAYRTVSGSSVPVRSITKQGVASVFGTNYLDQIGSTGAPTSGSLTLLVVARRNAADGIRAAMGRANGGTSGGFEIALCNNFGSPPTRVYSSYKNNSGTQVGFDAGFVNGVADSCNGTYDTVTGELYTIVVRADNIGACAKAIRLGALDNGAAATGFLGGDIVFACAWDRKVPNATMRDWSANPLRLFEAQPPMLFAGVAPAVDTALTGAAAAVASATGGLTTSIRLAASASALASASASLTTQIALSGTASAAASASAALTTAIRLAGAASAQASTTGSLTTSIPLAGSAVASASASASLAGSAAALSGAAVASAAASGQLSTQIPLSGAAVAQAAASASLTANGQGLSGAASASASASGALTTSIALSGAAVAQASAAGTFSGSAAALSGAALASAVASGQLATQIVLRGSAVAGSSASGSLMTAIRLSGGASATARALGDLAIGVRYARAPDGPGYSRPFTNTTRPKQVNTRRQ